VDGAAGQRISDEVADHEVSIERKMRLCTQCRR
jgi:hypothetical protein